jgi:transposase
MLHQSVGVDVSGDALEIGSEWDSKPTKIFRVNNDEEGFATAYERLSRTSPPESWRIVVEATSTHHRAFALWMAGRGVQVLVLNPKQARDLARGLGVLRKNDRTDAEVLAQCAKMAWREPIALASGKPYELQELSRRIGVLTFQRAQERKRLLKAGACEAFTDSCRRHIEFLSQEIAELERQWEALIGECEELDQIRKNVLSVPGVGKSTARVLISELFVVQMERTSRQCVAYAGLAPQEHSSGKSLNRPGKLVPTGNKLLRRGLYMGAVSAIRNDTESRDLYMRLVEKGKHKKVALVAVMNKMMRRIVAVSKRGDPWRPTLT